MSGDVLETLKSRNRAIVQERPDPLISPGVNHQKLPNTISVELDQSAAGSTNAPDSSDDFAKDEYPGRLRRTTVRLNEAISLQIDSLCSRHQLTPETLVEALLCQAEESSQMMEKVVLDAKERYDLRKKVGVKRRAKAMQKYN